MDFLDKEISIFGFYLKQKNNVKNFQDLCYGDILKRKNKEIYYQYDYVVGDDKGECVIFKCPYGVGSIIVRKKGISKFFETKNNSYVLYEKIQK